MLSVQSAFVFLIVCLIFSNLGIPIDPIVNDLHIAPWTGILLLKSEDSNRSEAASGLVLIKKHLAVGNANDIAKVKINTLRKYASAMFYKDLGWQNFAVKDYMLHPEYFDGVKNTIALLHLAQSRDDISWDLARWPTVDRIDDDVYSIGLTDSHKRLQQVFREMERVKDADCDKFYKQERLDYKSLQPSHNVCYKEMSSWKKCVVDAGTALAFKKQNKWTLIGISTHGPGCSLPSRYIRFFPYIPWIKAHSRPTMTQGSFRRSYAAYKQGLEEPYVDLDSYILSFLNKNTVVIRPSNAYVKENVYGECNEIDGILMYREFGTIRAPTHTATGIHSFSIYDLFFSHITCVTVTVICDKRSKTVFWFSKGFHQEDLEDYLKIVPSPKRNYTKLPRILYLKDTYRKYENIKTAHLYFKFEFTNEAKIDLQFYGQNVSSPIIPQFSTQKETSRNFKDGVNFNAREGDQEDDLHANDSFFHFRR